jgi:hypothetical protein
VPDAIDEALLAVLKALAVALPSFGAWLAGVLDGRDERPAFTRRVRDVLPETGASRAAATKLAEGE